MGRLTAAAVTGSLMRRALGAVTVAGRAEPVLQGRFDDRLLRVGFDVTDRSLGRGPTQQAYNSGPEAHRHRVTHNFQRRFFGRRRGPPGTAAAD